VLAEVFAERVMTFASARTLIRFSSLGAGRMVRESDMGNLDDLPDLLSSQLAAPLHRKLGRTVKAGQTQEIGKIENRLNHFRGLRERWEARPE
jgi:hypothetical protein